MIVCCAILGSITDFLLKIMMQRLLYIVLSSFKPDV